MPARPPTPASAVVALSAVLVVTAGLAGVLVLGRGQDVLLGAPPVPPDAADAPLVLPPDVPDPGGYTFLTTGPGGDPARWDPCRPVHVVVRPQDEPDGGREAVTAALEQVGRAAGLVFVVDGETDEPPAEDRPLVDEARYGDRWSPVLVAWSSAAEQPELAGAIGRAGPAADADDPGVWVSGTVVLDAAWFADALPADIGRRQADAVLAHELAHLVGLGHSADPFSLMSPTYQSVFGFSLSDRAGLARLGGGACAGGDRTDG